MLSFNLSQELIKQLQELNNAFAYAYAKIIHTPENVKEAIHKYAKISMIGASTRIENAVLTDPEIEWLDAVLTQEGKTTAFLSKKSIIQHKLNKDKERSIEEVAGCRGMLELVYAQAKEFMPLTESIIRGLHDELMRYYSPAVSYRGRYKIQPTSVIETNHKTGEIRTVSETAEAGLITSSAMADLVKWYNETSVTNPWSVAVACEFTYRFLTIHPFQDGNGRLGRGLFLLSLLQAPAEVISTVSHYLVIDRHIERKRSEYYYVLNKCSKGKYLRNPKGYHIEYFLSFMIKILLDALKDIEIYKNRFDTYLLLSESTKSVLSCFKEHPEIRLSSQEVERLTNLPKRTVTYCLSILTKNHFIQKYGQGAGVRYQLIF